MIPADRIGVDVGVRLPLEGAVQWAVDEGVTYVDVRPTDEILESGGLDDETESKLVETIADDGISLGLHTLSAINTAAYSPYVADGVEQYLEAFVDLADRLNADRIIVHAGYHFTSDEDARRRASMDRLARLAEYAAARDVKLLLENMNPEPADAEVHYLCSELDDCKRYFETLLSETVAWAFNPPHANLHPTGVHGYLDELDLGVCGEVRLNDNRGIKEEHLPIGEGNIDFERLFDTLERRQYDGHYMLAFGTLEQMLAHRSELATAH